MKTYSRFCVGSWFGFLLSLAGAWAQDRPLEAAAPRPYLAYSTYFGGDSFDEDLWVAVDASGCAYIAGISGSEDLPYTTRLSDGMGVFVAKLNAEGSALVYLTLIGYGRPKGITVDARGNAHVVGTTIVNYFPVTNAVQSAYGGGGSDGFVCKLNAAGTALIYSTYIGGGDEDEVSAIAVDSAGNAFVTGTTRSPDFPTTNAFQPQLSGESDAYVVRLDATGAQRVWATYLGGAGKEAGAGIALDTAGNICLVGRTTSTDFPKRNPLQAGLAGTFDAYVSQFNAAGTGLLFSTCLGGSDSDWAGGIAVDPAGDLLVVGTTRSADFPTNQARQPNLMGGTDGFVVKIRPPEGALVYSTFFGGSGMESLNGIASDAAGNAYLSGWTDSDDFPLVNSMKPAKIPYTSDAFIARLNPPGSALDYSTFLGASGGDSANAIALDPAGNAFVAGVTEQASHPPFFPTTPGVWQAGFGGAWNDGFVAKIRSAANPPANDNFSQRWLLRGSPLTSLANNTGASVEPGEPAHAGNPGGHSLWWTWVAPATGQLILTTAGSDFDTLLAVYRGQTVSELALLAGNDNEVDEGDMTSRVRLPVVGGQAYEIAVDGAAGAAGAIVLSLILSVPPNDDFANATVLSGLPVTVSGSNRDGTMESGEIDPSLNLGGRSVWWSWTALTNGHVTATATGTRFRPLVEIYTGESLFDLISVGSFDADPQLTNSQVSFKALAGTVYHLKVDGERGAAGDFTLNLAPARSPTNDDFAQRTLLQGLHVTDQSSNLGATKEFGEPDLGFDYPAGATVWWSWTAPTNGNFLLTTTGSPFDTRLAVFTGTALTNLSLLINNDNSSETANTSRLVFPAVRDTPYHFAVDSWSWGDSGPITLNLNLNEPPEFLPASVQRGANGPFQCLLKGVPEQTYILLASTNLLDWTPLMTNTMTSQPMEFIDAEATPYPRRYYRAVAAP